MIVADCDRFVAALEASERAVMARGPLRPMPVLRDLEAIRELMSRRK